MRIRIRLVVSAAATLFSAASTSAISFSAYRSSDAYKCGTYKKGRVDDQALSHYYSAIRQLISWISLPFPHQELLTDGALMGDPREWQASFEHKYPQWLSFEQYTVGACAGIVLFALSFPVLYVLGRCLHACCTSSAKKKAAAATEGPFDSCKRHSLNALLVIFVLIDVFAAAALLVTGQYAEYGMEQLPLRLQQCVDDLNTYKHETSNQVKKLLIDDWKELNASLCEQMDSSGHQVIDRLKKVTGAHALDVFMNVSDEARHVETVMTSLRRQLATVQEDASRFTVEFGRLRKTATDEIAGCMQRESESLKRMCSKANELMDGFQKIDVGIDTSFLDVFDHNGDEAMVLANISSLLSPSSAHFAELESRIQRQIDSRTGQARDVLKQIGDDLFLIAEKISSRIGQVSVEPLYTGISSLTSSDGLDAMKYIKYSWYASLVLTGLFMLLSLAFLFGLFYGVCGRRASYYNDDCCVRSTGSKFFSCGIWLSVLLFTALAVAAAALLLVFSNVTHLVCDPLERPLARPDMLSLAERVARLVRDAEAEESTSTRDDLAAFLARHSIADVIRSCERNETFYQMLDLDGAYHLNELESHEKEALARFDAALEALLAKLPTEDKMANFVPANVMQQLQRLATVNITKLSGDALGKIQSTIRELDLMARLRQFEDALPSSSDGKPQAVSSIIVQVDALDKQIAAPLRRKLETLHSNLTSLNDRLSDLHVPVGSLLQKLTHAQALLSADVHSHIVKAATDVASQLKASCSDYIAHVKQQVNTEVTSCEPLVRTLQDSRDAVCLYTIDPINGSWMSMLVCLAVTFPIVLVCTALIGLYNKMHPYPKYDDDVTVDMNQINNEQSSEAASCMNPSTTTQCPPS